MKTLLIVSALTLIANTALANDIYGAFVNSDVDSTYGNNDGATFPVIQPHGFQPSIVAFHKGNPEYPHGFEGAVSSGFHATGTLTAYDDLMRGNPDSGPVERSDLTSRQFNARQFALDTRLDGDRI